MRKLKIIEETQLAQTPTPSQQGHLAGGEQTWTLFLESLCLFGCCVVIVGCAAWLVGS